MSERNRVLALGCFDGVHLGHQALLRKTLQLAEEKALTPGIWVMRGKPGLWGGRLCDAAGQEALFAACGVKIVFCSDFEEVQSLSCEAFVREILIRRFGCAVAVCGENFRFGKDRAGDAAVLQSLLRRYGGDAVILPTLEIGQLPVSSSRIRTLLREGKPEQAAALLGHPYTVESEVRHGRGEGKGFGFPTANQPLPTGMLPPKYGVYETHLTLPDGRSFVGCTNFGVHPTFGEAPEALFESHLPDYRGEALYGCRVRLSLCRYLREERQFSSLTALQAQIREDLLAIRKEAPEAPAN